MPTREQLTKELSATVAGVSHNSTFKDADGKRGKIEIGAPDMVKKFLNIFQSIGEGIYYQAILGEKQKTDEWKIAKRAQYLSTFDLGKSILLVIPASFLRLNL